MTGPTDRIESAQREVERAKREFASTLGALQYRLKPANLASDAWDGVREKSGEMADDALQTVKQRPVAAAGVLTAIALFMARGPLQRAVTGFFGRGEQEDETGVIKADLDHHAEQYDLTAPTVKRRKTEGVNA